MAAKHPARKIPRPASRPLETLTKIAAQNLDGYFFKLYLLSRTVVRFAWQEIIAADNTEMLDVLGDLKEEVITKMNNLNNAIWNSATGNGIEGLNNAYHIGGAYFCKLTHYLDENQSNVDEAYRLLWDNHLRGVLFEYLRGSVDAMENLKMLENIFFKTDSDVMPE